jgi:hypothetical protein
LFAFEHEDLAEDKRALVRGRIASDRASGLLRSEAASGVSASHAISQFEIACAGFLHERKVLAVGGKETRHEGRLYLEKLNRALTALESAAADIQTLIGCDLYGEMPEGVFEALRGQYPVSREDMARATSYTEYAPDPLAWRREGMAAVGQIERWAERAKIRIASVTAAYSQPGRAPGTPDSMLASDLLDFLRLLDRSDVDPVRPIARAHLRSWLEFTHDLCGAPTINNTAVTAKHALESAGPHKNWTRPPHPETQAPREIFRISIDHNRKVTREA